MDLGDSLNGVLSALLGSGSGTGGVAADQATDYSTFLNSLLGGGAPQQASQAAAPDASAGVFNGLRAATAPAAQAAQDPVLSALSGVTGGAATAAKNTTAPTWLDALLAGDKTASNQAKLGIGALGLLGSILTRNSKRNRQSPTDLQAALRSPYSSWTPQQQQAADNYFNSGRQFTYQPPNIGMADGGPVMVLEDGRLVPKLGTRSKRPGGTGGGLSELAVPAPMPAASAPGALTVDPTNPRAVNAVRERAAGLRRGGALPGNTGGQEDVVPINGAAGEYMVDADTVSALGDGNTAAGVAALDNMRQQVRTHKRSAPASKIPPKAKSPLEYMRKGAK